MFIRRVITVVIAVPIVVGAILCPYTWVFKLLVFACILAALMEAVGIILPDAGKRDNVLAAVVGGGLSASILFWPDANRHFMGAVALILFIILFFYMRRSESVIGIAGKVAGATFVIFYVALLASYVGLLRDRPDGIFWVLVAIGATWFNDTFAYFTGKALGRQPLASHLSPAKTAEGFWGGFVGSALGVALFKWLLPDSLSVAQAVFLALLIGSLAPLGDLAESLLKRSAKVKDSGFIIPGHGGMLDRLDALLFVAPAVYYFSLCVA